MIPAGRQIRLTREVAGYPAGSLGRVGEIPRGGMWDVQVLLDVLKREPVEFQAICVDWHEIEEVAS